MKRFITIVLVMLLLPLVAQAKAKKNTSDYYAVLINNQKVGHAVIQQIVSKDRIRSSQKVTMKITRMNVPIEISMTETHIETPEGKPLGFECLQNMSGFNMKITGTIREDGTVEATTRSAAGVKKDTFKWPEGAIMVEGLSQMTEKKGLSEGTTYEVNIFSAIMMTALPTKITVGSEKEIDLLGRIVTAREMKSVVRGAMTGEIVETSYVNDDYEMLKSVTPMMGMQMELVVCSREFALSENDVVDFFDKLVLAAPHSLPGIEQADSVQYHLVPTGDKKISLPETIAQTTQPDPRGGLKITVTPQKPPAGVLFPYKGKDKKALTALEPNRFLQSDQKPIIRLARRAVGDAKDVAEAARRIERFVNNYIDEKNLSIGYASAAEVVRSRQGDCSEHAVLVAALCRAVGIPAEVVVGLVHFKHPASGKEMFGPHAWAHAYLNGQWYGLDATGDGKPRAYRGGHLMLGAGAGDLDDFFNLISSLGYFKIADVQIK